MSIINFNYNNRVISQREDGYINLTQMCRANKKQIGHYLSLKSTNAYIERVSIDIGIPISELVDVIKGGEPEKQGSWGHKLIAVNLARWISPAFAVWCDAHIFNLMSTGQTSLEIDPFEEMKLKVELARLEAEKEKAIASAKQSELALTQFRHSITLTCPEPVQQKVLGYSEVTKVEYRDRFIKNDEVLDDKGGYGITNIQKRYGFKSTKQAWDWLNSVGYGKDSEYWDKGIYIREGAKLSYAAIAHLDEIFAGANCRQLYLGE